MPDETKYFSSVLCELCGSSSTALTTAIFILGAEAYLFIFIRGKDDIAGGAMMGDFIILVSAIIATAAAVFERVLQNAVEITSV